MNGSKQPFTTTIPKQKGKEVEAGGFIERWAPTCKNREQGELLQCLADSVRKGYFRMDEEGKLVLTEKGAYRELMRAGKVKE